MTQIYQSKLMEKTAAQIKLLDSLLEDVENLLASDEIGYDWSKKNYVAGYTSYGSVDKLHLVFPAFKTLEKALDKHIKNYIKDLDFAITSDDVYLSHCWANVMPQEAQHTAHIHPLSVISGTLYLQLPKGSSAIKFEDPRLGLFMNAPVVKTKAQTKNKRFLDVLPDVGDVILFESWLRHEVPRNRSKDPRISISFNYGWKKA